MVLNLKDLFAGGRDLTFDYELDMSGFEAAPGEFPFRQPVHVQGTAVNRAGVVTLSAAADCRYFTRCDRCLKEIEEHFVVPVENTLVTERSSEEDEDMIVCESETLDLDSLIETNVILSLSMKHLCSEDCRGLCPVCGKNLNEGDCGCDRENKESPFAQLKNLME